MSCSWCGKCDEHEEFCNNCNFCDDNICCDCWDGDETCYFPGEGYCPRCKIILNNCPVCVAYIDGLMNGPDMPICEKHWHNKLT